MSNFEPLTPQLTRQFAAGLACPFETRDRIARRGILQQFFQCCQNARLFFSTQGRPPPGRRTRPRNGSGTWRASRCPCAMVGRLNPVISAVRWMPPHPNRNAHTPATKRRFFSSSAAMTRLRLRCSSATSPRGWRWHSAHSQRCAFLNVLFDMWTDLGREWSDYLSRRSGLIEM